MNVVITGASKGIGKAIALKFATEGHNLALCSRSLSDLEKLKNEILAINVDLSVHVFDCDVSNKNELMTFATNVKEAFSTIDVLVNNAGVFNPGQIYKEAEGTLENMMNTNLYSAYYLTRALVDKMIANNSGYIFNMCSIASNTAYPNGGSYSISKFALLGFSKNLREELKEYNIGVTAILPGATLTDSWAGTDLPEERFMKAEDVADVVFNTCQLSPRTVVEEIILRPMLGDI